MTYTKTCKVVTVGDGAVGKTCLLMVFCNNEFPTNYVPTIFENYDTIMRWQEGIVKLSLWDTAGQEEYDNLRYLSYSKSSFNNVKYKWAPEVQQHAPNAAIILVATKTDLRNNNEIPISEREKFITREQGEQLAKEIQAIAFIETSARENRGVKEIFDKCLEHFCNDKQTTDRSCCIII